MMPSCFQLRSIKKALALLSVLLCLVTLGLAPNNSQAQRWPTKPIKLVVPYPPGGGADLIARLIAPAISESLGTSVVIENKGGASGQIGAELVARSAADGYTLLLDASPFAINPVLYPKLPYDGINAFVTVGIISLFPHVVVVTPEYRAKNLAELIDLARTQPELVSYASSGNGTSQHLAALLFMSRSGINMTHVPYKGGGPAMADVMAGHVPVFFANLASSLGHIRNGKLRPLALTSEKRSSALPEVATLAELGITGAEVYEWNGLFAPAGTPKEIVYRITDALAQALASDELRQRINALGGEIFVGKQAQAQAFVNQQTQLWTRIVRERNLKIEN